MKFATIIVGLLGITTSAIAADGDTSSDEEVIMVTEITGTVTEEVTGPIILNPPESQAAESEATPPTTQSSVVPLHPLSDYSDIVPIAETTTSATLLPISSAVEEPTVASIANDANAVSYVPQLGMIIFGMFEMVF